MEEEEEEEESDLGACVDWCVLVALMLFWF